MEDEMLSLSIVRLLLMNRPQDSVLALNPGVVASQVDWSWMTAPLG